MKFLRITATDGTRKWITPDYLQSVSTAADTLDAGSNYSAPKVIRGKISGLQYKDNTNSLSAPVANAPSTATTGGTLAAGTYYYVVTAINSVGETIKSNEVSIATTGATSTVTVTWGVVTGATGYKIYRGTSAGNENVYYSVGAVTTFTDTNGASTAGTPPTSNTTSISFTSVITVVAYNGANTLYEVGCLTVDGAFVVLLTN